MTKDVPCRLAFWALFATYAAYLIGLALVEPLVTNHTLSAAVVQCLWYSLASAAVAVGCWIELGDGSGAVRLIVGAWSLICVWIVCSKYFATCIAFVLP